MQIVIDSAIVDRYVSALAGYEKLLSEATRKKEEAEARADADHLFTIEQACQYLGVSDDTLLYYRKLGLDYYKKGKAGVWYRKGDIDDWLASGKVSRRKE